MLRKIITIDQEKCNGCGLCAQACHEQAIGMVDGKAALLRDDYCDGLGDCLPVCPTNAITFEVREAAAYDEAAVLANKASQEADDLVRLHLFSISQHTGPFTASAGTCTSAAGSHAPKQRAAAMACPDQAGQPARTLPAKQQAAGCRRLYRLRIRRFPP